MARQVNSYIAKYKDPRWQKKRLAILERDDFTCQVCFDSGSTLHVHHRVYNKGCDPWDYDDRLLVTLCEECHEQETQDRREADEDLIRAFRTHFLSGDIFDMACSLGSAEHLPRGSDVVSCSLSYLFRTPEVFRAFVEDYLDGVVKRGKEREARNG